MTWIEAKEIAYEMHLERKLREDRNKISETVITPEKFETIVDTPVDIPPDPLSIWTEEVRCAIRTSIPRLHHIRNDPNRLMDLVDRVSRSSGHSPFGQWSLLAPLEIPKGDERISLKGELKVPYLAFDGKSYSILKILTPNIRPPLQSRGTNAANRSVMRILLDRYGSLDDFSLQMNALSYSDLRHDPALILPRYDTAFVEYSGLKGKLLYTVEPVMFSDLEKLIRGERFFLNKAAKRVDIIKLDRVIGIKEKYILAEGIINALASVHKSGNVHGDLKPDNILIDQVGKTLVAKVSDFDLAVMKGYDGGTDIALAGSTACLPESLENAKTMDRALRKTAADDVFCLGEILFYLFSSHASDGRVTAEFNKLTKESQRLEKQQRRKLVRDYVEKSLQEIKGPLKEGWETPYTGIIRKCMNGEYASSVDVKSDLDKYLHSLTTRRNVLVGGLGLTASIAGVEFLKRWLHKANPSETSAAQLLRTLFFYQNKLSDHPDYGLKNSLLGHYKFINAQHLTHRQWSRYEISDKTLRERTFTFNLDAGKDGTVMVMVQAPEWENPRNPLNKFVWAYFSESESMLLKSLEMWHKKSFDPSRYYKKPVQPIKKNLELPKDVAWVAQSLGESNMQLIRFALERSPLVYIEQGLDGHIDENYDRTFCISERIKYSSVEDETLDSFDLKRCYEWTEQRVQDHFKRIFNGEKPPLAYKDSSKDDANSDE